MRVKVISDESVELLASNIKEISEGVKVLRSGALNDKCLLLLIEYASGVGKKQIKAVLDALESLEDQYLKKHDE